MPDEFAKRADFKTRLESEVQRILEDPSFLRSPVISRLLRYLSDQSIRADRVPITQFSIAVEGLGRREDYDQDSESYVRVQISRLRKSLAEYYTRNKPGDDLCVFLRQGDYNLRLGSPERAYPQQNRTGTPAESTSETAVAEGSRRSARAKAQPPFRSILAVAAIIVAVWCGIWFVPGMLRGDAPLSGPPRVRVNVGGPTTPGEGPPPSSLEKVAEMTVRKTIAASMVSRASGSSAPDYTLLITFDEDGNTPTNAFLRLSDASDYVLFAQTVEVGDDEGRFANRLGATLADLFSSSGVIAKNLTDRIPGRKQRNDFECFLVTEANLAVGEIVDQALQSCIEKYPGSQYAPFWLSRLAQSKYQAAAAQGRPIRRNEDGWEYLVRAFIHDRYNSYANAVAAKIELAEGDCAQATFYLDRAQSRGISNPLLYTSLAVDSLPCYTAPGQLEPRKRGLDYMISSHPDSTSGHLLYLVLGALELGRPAQARNMLEEAISRPPKDGRVGQTLDLLEQALGVNSSKPPDREKLRRSVAQFIWSEQTQKIILDQLDRARTAG